MSLNIGYWFGISFYSEHFWFTERQGDRLRLYNLTSVGDEREWLRNVLLSSESDTSSDEDTPEGKRLRLKQLLKERHYHNKYAKEYYKDQGVIIISYIYK